MSEHRLLAVTFPRVLAAEWSKLTSVSSTLWIAAGTVVSTVALAFGLGLFVRSGDTVSGASLAVSGSLFAQVGMLVLGALVGAGEFSTGTSMATFAAVPRRLPVLAAQTLVTAAVALLTAVVALVASILATAPARSAAGLTLEFADAGTVRVLAGFVLYLTGVAVLGIGLGALVRRPAGALVTGVVALVVVDQLLATNPGRVTDVLRAASPASGTRLFADDATLAALTGGPAPDLGARGGGLVFAAWVIAVLAGAAYRLRRYDVT
ncbi:ABC transporter permease [Cryptosporangium arvum]|uniref:ABC transporter permease n=1 Tax=Cryptosporangium arvum TaxID=80871 RepID=UPI0004B51D1F|nr:ABC transporter permease [Cryptosporangium arvum]